MCVEKLSTGGLSLAFKAKDTEEQGSLRFRAYGLDSIFIIYLSDPFFILVVILSRWEQFFFWIFFFF